MKNYIELWKAKDSWKSLSREERGNYLSLLGPHIQNFIENGVEIVSWGVNEDITFQRVEYDFFAIWNIPNSKIVEEFEKLVEEAGWYNYFEQVNACGTATSPDEVLGKLIEM